MKVKLNEKCKKCGMACLVTKHCNGTDREEKDYYYQCLADMERECFNEDEEMNIRIEDKFLVMFWNAWNEAILFDTQSQFEFDTEEKAKDFIESINVKGCKEVTINNDCYEVFNYNGKQYFK